MSESPETFSRRAFGAEFYLFRWKDRIKVVRMGKGIDEVMVLEPDGYGRACIRVGAEQRLVTLMGMFPAAYSLSGRPLKKT